MYCVLLFLKNLGKKNLILEIFFLIVGDFSVKVLVFEFLFIFVGFVDIFGFFC